LSIPRQFAHQLSAITYVKVMLEDKKKVFAMTFKTSELFPCKPQFDNIIIKQ